MRQVGTAEVKALAGLAGVTVPEERLDTLAKRIQGMLDGVTMIEALPLGDEEPANIFRSAEQE